MSLLKKIIYVTLLTVLSLPACSSPEKEKKHEEHEGKERESEIHLSKEVLETLKPEWAEVKRQPLYQEIQVTGRVVQDPNNVSFVFTNSAGSVRKLFVRVGDKVKSGQPLLQIGGRTLKAPKKGTVISINTSVGTRVGVMQSLVAIAELDPIRVVFDVYPKDMDRVSIEQKVEVELIGHPEHLFPGTVQYLSPSLDEVSQTLKVGADVENIDHHLKFGMFVQGKSRNETEEKILAVPEAAVVRFNQDFAVFVPGDETGAFLKRPVHIGRRGKGMVEILEGLKEGEKVVTKGSFTLKSEFLRGSLGGGHAH